MKTKQYVWIGLALIGGWALWRTIKNRAAASTVTKNGEGPILVIGPGQITGRDKSQEQGGLTSGGGLAQP